VFAVTYDAEGNGTIENDAGISLNGDDYSGYATFDPTGALVAYGDMASAAGPHYSSVVVVRDAVTGDRLWSTDVGVPFLDLSFVDQRLVVVLTEGAEAVFDGNPMPDAALVFDGYTGQELNRVDLGFHLIHLS